MWKIKKPDNRGSAVVEAALYYPIIIMVVLVVVVISLFKLDQIVMQADASVSAMYTQMEQDRLGKGERQSVSMRGDGLAPDDHILTVSSEQRRNSEYWQTGYCLREIGIQNNYAARNNTMFPFMNLQRTPEYWVSGKPYETALALRTIQMDDAGEIEYKLGYTLDEYMRYQYGDW